MSTIHDKTTNGVHRIPRRGVRRLERDKMTARDVFLAAASPPTAATETRSRQQLADAKGRTDRITAEVKTVLTQFCGVRGFKRPHLELPSFAAGFDPDAVQNSFALWADQMVAQLDPTRIGYVTWHGRDRTTYDFVDSTTKTGLMNRETQYHRHAHHLLRCRVHPATHPEVDLPPQAAAILRTFGVLLPHVGILTGTLVGEGQRPLDSTTERTAFGAAVDHGVAAAKQGMRTAERATTDGIQLAARAAHATSSAAAATAGVVGTGATLALGLPIAFLAMLASDPGILIGDRVIFGWKD